MYRSERPTEAYKGGASVLTKAMDISSGLIRTYAASGICISTAGMVDTQKGEIFYSSPLIPDYAGTGFKEIMEREYAIPCEVGYMHLEDSDFQTLGAASILTKKVARWKQEPEKMWNGYHIFEEAKAGDEICNRAIDEMVDILGKGISNICYVVNPEVVVLGGGIMAQEEFLRKKIESALERYLIPNIAVNTRIEFARHRNDAGMLGAFYHFMGRHRDR